MFVPDQTAFQNCTLIAKSRTSSRPAPQDTRAQRLAGLVAGTLVETSDGWRPVESLQVGDHVQTFDGGLRPLRRIERNCYRAGHAGYTLERVLHVPGGALDNCDALLLMPGQRVLIDSCIAEHLLGTSMVSLPASALDGYRGICRVSVNGGINTFTLGFDDEEIVYVNSGLLIHCATVEESEFFSSLDHARGRAFLTLLDCSMQDQTMPGMDECKSLAA